MKYALEPLMNTFTISWWMLINLITLDVLLGLLQRHTRENSYTKTPGLLALFVLSLTRKHVILINQKVSFRRFMLGAFTSLALITACFYVLKNGLKESQSVALLPLIAMPFYYLIYGLMGNNLLAVGASIKNFRLRLMLVLVLAANITMITITDQINLLVQAVHVALALIALAHLFFLASQPRSEPSFYNLNQEDYDVAQPAFMNYLASILEYFYYSLLLYFAADPSIINALAPTQPAFIVMPVFFAVLYVTSLILAKILLVSRAIISLDVYENRIVPLSFLFFGMSYIYQVYF